VPNISQSNAPCVSSLDVQCYVFEFKEGMRPSLVSEMSVLVYGEILQLEMLDLNQTQVHHTEDCHAFVKCGNLHREALIGKWD
jgi:hypothetical protein